MFKLFKKFNLFNRKKMNVLTPKIIADTFLDCIVCMLLINKEHVIDVAEYNKLKDLYNEFLEFKISDSEFAQIYESATNQMMLQKVVNIPANSMSPSEKEHLFKNICVFYSMREKISNVEGYVIRSTASLLKIDNKIFLEILENFL